MVLINTILKSNTKIYASFALLIILFYAQSLFYGFSPMDEQWLIIKKASTLGNFNSIINAFTKPAIGIYYRPFLMLSFILDYKLAKLNPLCFHLSNIIYHFVFCCLLYKFLIKFNSEKRTVLLLLFIFIAHPLLLHAVAWIPGRNDVILGVFTLAALITLQNFLSTQKTHYAITHFVFFICALLTKENAIVLPFIFIYIYFTTTLKHKNKFVAFCVCWFLISLTWYLLRVNIVHNLLPTGTDLTVTIKNFIYANFIYLGKVVIPYNLSVFPVLKNSSIIAGVLSVLLLIFSWCYVGVKSKSIALLGLFIYVIVLAIPIWFGSANSAGEHFEHRAYTSLAGLFLYLSQLKINWANIKTTYVISLILILFGIKTITRIKVYESEISFTNAGLIDAPNYYLFQVQKGEYEFASKNYLAAINYFTNALKLRTDKAEIYNGRANCYSAINQHKKAINDYTKCFDLVGYNETVFINKCTAYYLLGDFENAMKDLQTLKQNRATHIAPNMDKTITTKWMTFEIEKLTKQIITQPNNDGLFYERAKYYFKLKQYNNVKLDLKTASLINPKNIEYKNALLQLNF